ncbi:MAG TPA: HNH endonuclease, partial [Azospirillaceae bacterium]|nr:HNH endonuclease [Azospirillaceae bacterium]
MSGTSKPPASAPIAAPPSPDDARLMDVQQGGRCFLCGEPVGAKATYDHLIPRAYGGADVAGNVVLVHARCNKKKADRLPTPDEIDRFIAMRKGSRLGVWPPLLALRQAEEGEEWIV